MLFTYAVILLAFATIGWYLVTYNALTNARNAVDQAWSNVEVELKRRLDLIDNLVQVVKGYSAHEASTLERTVQLRASTTNATQAATAEPQIKQSLGQIVALAESYPDLKANQQFLSLQTELANTENRIAERRHAYNQNVSRYRLQQQEFPANLVAQAHTFAPKDFFDAPDEEIQQVPEVKL